MTFGPVKNDLFIKACVLICYISGVAEAQSSLFQRFELGTTSIDHYLETVKHLTTKKIRLAHKTKLVQLEAFVL